MAVITISRLHGTGGRLFGLRLAKALGYDYFDKEILDLLSDRLEQHEGRITLYEEAGYGPSKSLLAMVGRKYPCAERDFPKSKQYVAAVKEILLDLAARDRVVIVGRGGQAVLAGHPGAVHLRLVAGEDFLVRGLSEQKSFLGLSDGEIRRRIARTNEQRRKFVRTHFGIDSSDPLPYHLVMNMERLDTGEAEAAALAVVSQRDDETPPPLPGGK